MHPTIGLMALCGCLVHQAFALPAVGFKVHKEAAKITRATSQVTGINLDTKAIGFSFEVRSTSSQEVPSNFGYVVPGSAPISTIGFDGRYSSYTGASSQHMATGLKPAHTVNETTLTRHGYPYTAVPSHQNTPGPQAGTRTSVQGQPMVTPMKPSAQNTSIPQYGTPGINLHTKSTASGHEQAHITGSRPSADGGSFQRHSTTQVAVGSETTRPMHPKITGTGRGEHYTHQRPGGHFRHQRPGGHHGEHCPQREFEHTKYGS